MIPEADNHFNQELPEDTPVVLETDYDMLYEEYKELFEKYEEVEEMINTLYRKV